MNKLIIPSKTERLFEKNSFLLIRGHDYIEIGGIKWATCNIGAEKPTDIGLYFQWGDIQGYKPEQVGISEGRKYFHWTDYKHYDIGYGLLKYNGTDSKTELDISDDAVHAAWGGAWRIPTKEEFDALACGKAVTFWTKNYQGSGVAGLVCTDKTDSSKELFFPNTGFGFSGKINNVNSNGFYWSRNIDYGFNHNGYGLIFCNSSYAMTTDNCRSFGFPIRGVLDI